MFAAKVGPTENMTCLRLVCDPAEKRDRTALSNFHFQILKTRMLAFGATRILVSPDPESDLGVVAVFDRTSVDAANLRDFLAELNLRVDRSGEVNPATLEMCFDYTLKARLAPLWNPIGPDTLARGRNFLTATDTPEAVELHVRVCDETILLQIQPYKLKMRPLEMSDLDVSSKSLEYFLDVPDAVLSEYSLMDQWVHVLPSLKKGKIVNINRKFPASSSFKNYREIRRHWKNIYGYRLPEDEGELLFYDIHFRPLGPNLYTYPSICLRPDLPLRVTPPPNRQKEILNSFLQDVASQLPYILGNEVTFGYFDPAIKLLQPNVHYEEPILNLKTPDFTQNISLCTPTQRVLNSYNDSDNLQAFKKNLNSYIFSNRKDSFTNPQHQKNDIKIKPSFKPKNKDVTTKNLINSFGDKSNKSFNLNTLNCEVTNSLNTKSPSQNEIISKNINHYTYLPNKVPNAHNPVDLSNYNSKDSEILKFSDDAHKNRSQEFNNGSIIPAFFDSVKIFTEPTKNMTQEINTQKTVTSFFNSIKLGKDNQMKSTKTLSPMTKSNKSSNKMNDCNINISEIAKRNPVELKNLRVATLYSWICAQNVRVPKKSNKTELINKILEIVR